MKMDDALAQLMPQFLTTRRMNPPNNPMIAGSKNSVLLSTRSGTKRWEPKMALRFPVFVNGWLSCGCRKLPKVTIEIPGDGTFRIINTKEALAAFKKRAASFLQHSKSRTLRVVRQESAHRVPRQSRRRRRWKSESRAPQGLSPRTNRTPSSISFSIPASILSPPTARCLS